MSNPIAAARIAWITGASSGIGAATAQEMARQGWRVAISARRREKLEEIAAGADGMAGQLLPVPCDVTDGKAIAEALATIERTWGPVDLALLNAGVYIRDSLASFDVEAYASQVELNLVGTARCLAALRGPMMKRRGGHIVIVASVAGYRGLPASLAYGPTKAALINLAEALWIEARPYGIKVQCVCPGFVRTPATDTNPFAMPQLMEVEDAARALVRGLGRSSFEIRFPWLFTFVMNRLRGLNNRLYLPLIARSLGYKRGQPPPLAEPE